MKTSIEQQIKKIVKDLYGIEKEITLSLPPSKDLGDFATNIALTLAKEVHKAPSEIADEIKRELAQDAVIENIVIASPGFINIFLKKKDFVLSIIRSATKESEYFADTNIHNHISIEHTAANPNKHLHIGHLRNFSIGDTLVKLFTSRGYDVSVQYIYNDQGLQVAKVIWGFLHLHLLGLENIQKDIGSTGMKFDAIAAQIYVAAEKFLGNHEEYADEIRDIIKKMEEGGNDISTFSEETTEKILLGQIKTIEKFLVYYDQLVTETSMTQSGELEKVMHKLLGTGKVHKEEEGKNAGCIVINGLLDENGSTMPDKVLLRADGTALYTAKDIVLALWKFGLLDVSFRFKELTTQFNGKPLFFSIVHGGNAIQEAAKFHINVVDQRQSFAMDVVKESLRVLGYPEESHNYHHLAYETVVLSRDTATLLGIDISQIQSKVIPMSGRKGIEVTIDNLLERMTKEVLTKNETKDDKLTYEEAEKIAASALRYYMIKFGYNTIIIFDMQDALRADGDTGIYLMYAYVRAKKILQKTGIEEIDIEDLNPQYIPESVFDLATQLSLAKDVIQSASEDFEINKITTYAFSLAKAFTTFYQNVSVMNEQEEEQKKLYVALVRAYIHIYGGILDILGIQKPERM